METIKFVRERIREGQSVRFSAGDMECVLKDFDGILLKVSEVERQIRTRGLSDPAGIMKEIQKILCEAAGVEFKFIDMVPEEGKKDDLMKDLAHFAAGSGCTCPPPFSWEKDEGPCIRCRAKAWLESPEHSGQKDGGSKR